MSAPSRREKLQYKALSPGFYTDSKVRSWGRLPPHPTVLFNWILTGPVLGVLPGCASIGRYGMCELLRWEPPELDATMAVLVRDGVVQFDPDAPMLYLPRAVRFNPPSAPSNVTGWASDWRKLPDCVLKERAWHTLRGHCRHRDEGLAKRDRTNPLKSFEHAFSLAIQRPEESPIVAGTTGTHHRYPPQVPFSEPPQEQEQEQEIEQDLDPDSKPASRSSGVIPFECAARRGGAA